MKVTVGEPDLDVSIRDRLRYKGIKMSTLDENDSETTVPRRRGRPPATQTTITRRLLDEDDKENKEKKDELLTFQNLFAPDPENDVNQDIVIKVRVYRTDPNEGILGYIDDMEATEQTILDRWGGSTYRLDGMNGRGRVVRCRSLKIAGDPIFEGEAAESIYRKSKGLPPKHTLTNVGNSMSPQEIMAMMEARDKERRQEEKDKTEERKREAEERRKEEREFILERERLQREFDERKRKDDEERDRRRREDEREREDRRRKDLQEEQTRQQQFFAQMLQMTQQQANQTLSFVKESALSRGSQTDSTEALIKGVQLVLSIKEGLGGGDGEEDLLHSVVKNLPGMINAAGNAVGKAINEVKGNKQIPSVVNPQQGGLQLPPGELSNKFATIINKIREQGGNPELVLSSIADKILQPVMAAQNPKPVIMDPGIKKEESIEVASSSVVEPKEDEEVIRMKLSKKKND